MVVSDEGPKDGVHTLENIVKLFLPVRNLNKLVHVNLLLVLTFLLVYTAVAMVAWTDLMDLDLAPFYLPSQ
eukprot:1699287-Prorocentrum_lima.AAC.1